jgi:hypothetical protein
VEATLLDDIQKTNILKELRLLLYQECSQSLESRSPTEDRELTAETPKNTVLTIDEAQGVGLRW